MAKDQVMHPKQSGRTGGLKYGDTSKIKAPTPSVANVNPYNRKSK